MYDRVKIITGLVIFVLLVLIPFLYNGKASKAMPELSLPTTAKHCVLPAEALWVRDTPSSTGTERSTPHAEGGAALPGCTPG